MKTKKHIPILVVLFAAVFTLGAAARQDEYLGLPGDNLNLYAVMKLFQESETLEGFERKLNEQDSRINNLDLDNDGYVDYIQVIDNVERNTHYIVLRIALGAKESQDVAVFTVVRESDGSVIIQLIGDEALYGRNYIIEPIYDETPNPGYTGRSNGAQRVVVNRTTYVEVGAWPVIRFIYTPTYVVWRSPWYYSYYPSYWRPWSPFYWHYYHGYHAHYHSYYYGHFRYWKEYRHPHYHSYYYGPRRTYSTHVVTRINQGAYKTTYSRPELRKAGSELYVSDQNRRSAGSSVGNTSVRRSTTQSGGTRQSTTVNTRQRTTTSGSRQATSTSTQRRATSTGATRQSTSVNTERKSSTTGTSTRQSTSTSTQRRPAATGTTRQSTGVSSERKSTSASPATRPSTSTSPQRRATAAPSTSSGQRSQSQRTTSVQRSTSQSGSSGVSSSGRRTSGSKSSGTTSKPIQKSSSSSSSRDGGRR